MTTVHGPRARVPGARDTRRAWWSLLGFLPSFVLAFVVGEGLISLLGYPMGATDSPPWWAALTAAVPAMIVFVLPAALTVHFGRRAVRAGDLRARAPMLLALAAAAGFVLVNGVSALAIWLT